MSLIFSCLNMRRSASIAVFLCAISASSARAGDAVMLSDIFTGFASASSSPSNFIDLGGKCIFTANDGTNGTELYISDGFSGGTILIKDIFSGPGSSFPGNFTVMGSTLFFTANDGSTGTELWKTDGTANGTVLVKDIRSGPGSSSPTALIVVNSTLYFTADDGISGRELWKSDGTTNGTVMVKDINTSSAGASSVSSNVKFAVLTNTLFFAANDGTNGIELWKSDGTSGGTVMVQNINTTAGASSMTGNNEIVAMGGFVYFPATNSTAGREMWRSDGTINGATMLADLNNGTGNSNPDQLTVAGSFVYFRATSGALFVTDTELFRTNGGAPTQFDLNIQTSGLGDLSSSPTNLTAVGTDLFCRANVNQGTMAATAVGTELVRVNAAGTVTVYNIAAGSTSSNPTNLTAVGSSLLFSANDGVNGTELYSVASGSAAVTTHFLNASGSASPSNIRAIDATHACFTANDGNSGTELYLWNAGVVSQIKDINPGSDSSFPSGLVTVNLAVGGPTLFFAANDGFGVELFKSDTTLSGTIRVKDLNTSANSGNPQALTDFNGTLYFQATENTQGTELYKSNGTVAGTVLANDILAGSSSSSPTSLKVFNGSLFFSATDAVNGAELFRSNGATVTNAANLEAGASGSFPYQLNVAGSGLYFQAYKSAVNDYRYFRFDGASATEVTEGVSPPFTYAFPYSSVAIGSVLFFSAYTYDNTATDQGYELWRADGTTATLVKDIYPTSGFSSFPDILTVMGNTLYFVAEDDTHGRELWKSDGTAAGTTMVKDILVGSGSSDPNRLTVVGNVLYFTATDGSNGTELWRSDGTDAGTFMVKDIFPGTVGSNPHSLTASNGQLLFAASDGVNGFELWKSDGTAAGTVLVKDINPGAGSSMPFIGLEVPIFAAGSTGTALFAASDGVNGTELWRTNGTAAGTALVQDINPGNASSTPDGFALSGSNVFFRANNGANGTELWAIPLAKLLDPPVITQLTPSSVIAGSGAFQLVVDGQNFSSGAVLRFNGSNRTTVVNNISQLTATITAADVAAFGTASITVFTPAPGGGTSAPATFFIDATPVISSSLTANGSVNVPFNYTIVSIGTVPITYTVTGLPAGLTQSAGVISGTPTEVGSFSVTIMAQNSIGTDTETLALTIAAVPPSGPTNSQVDSDGDGFTDELEIAAGGSPTSGSVTPFGSTPAGVVQTLFVSKLQIGLNFAKPGSDSASISGLVSVPDGFVVASSKVVLDLGGVIQTFTLDTKGGSKVGSDSFKLSVKASKGVVLAQTSKFSAKYSKGNFQSKLTDEGLTNASASNAPKTVTAQMLFNQKLFKSDVSQLYNASAGKSGKTKLPTGAAILPGRGG